MAEDDKIRENRLRRQAERRGWKLEKSKRRDHFAADFGLFRLEADDGYTVIDKGSRVRGYEDRFVMTLDDVEDALKLIECSILRCGRQVLDIRGSDARGRRIEFGVCVEHATEIDAGTEGADWLLLTGDGPGHKYYVVLGDDAKLHLQNR